MITVEHIEPGRGGYLFTSELSAIPFFEVVQPLPEYAHFLGKALIIIAER